MPGEVEDDFSDASADHRLAIGIPDQGGNLNLRVIDPGQHSPLTALLELDLKDLNGDAQVDLVVTEDSATPGDSKRSLRIFSYSVGSEPKELFNEQLKVITPEQLEIIAEWKSGRVMGTPAILFQAAGVARIFTWDSSSGRFLFNEAATTAQNPKPASKPVEETIPGTEEKKEPEKTKKGQKKKRSKKTKNEEPPKLDLKELGLE